MLQITLAYTMITMLAYHFNYQTKELNNEKITHQQLSKSIKYHCKR